jgi:small-conductance mechanosensitive channel
LAIVLDKPFVVGDTIAVDTLVGTVEHVGLKTTRIRSVNGEQLIFGNTDLLKSRIRNFKRMQERRVVFVVGVTYDTPADTVARISDMLREAVEAQEQVRFERAHFTSYGDSTLNFETVYYVLSADYLTYANIHQAVNLAVLRRFAAEKIEFAYPTRTIVVKRSTSGEVIPARPIEQP